NVFERLLRGRIDDPAGQRSAQRRRLRDERCVTVAAEYHVDTGLHQHAGERRRKSNVVRLEVYDTAWPERFVTVPDGDTALRRNDRYRTLYRDAFEIQCEPLVKDRGATDVDPRRGGVVCCRVEKARSRMLGVVRLRAGRWRHREKHRQRDQHANTSTAHAWLPLGKSHD